MIVMAIAIALFTLTVSGFKMIAAYQVTAAASELNAVAKLARQTAFTSGKSVELRFYKLKSDSSDYSGYRLVKNETADVASSPTGTDLTKDRAISRMRRLPDRIVMKASVKASTLLTSGTDKVPEIKETGGISGFCGDNVKIVRFQPNGTIDLKNGEWTISIASESAPVVANGLPANFATVSFDEVLGTTEVFRP